MSAAAVDAARALRGRSQALWAEARSGEALEVAWAAFDLAPEAGANRRLLAGLLRAFPGELRDARRADYLSLVTDPGIEPDLFSTAGWRLVLGGFGPPETWPAAAERVALADLEGDRLVGVLLRQSPVYDAPAERFLGALRRRLLVTGDWRVCPDLAEALKVQARLNSGAWHFDEAERAALALPANRAMAEAYLPPRRGSLARAAGREDGSVTGAVAAQYEAWPYPAWTRVTVGRPRTLGESVRPMDPALADGIPKAAQVLVAGCGSGREAAAFAAQHPEAQVTAIDLSESSLAYGRERCTALGIGNVRFRRHDLYDVASLGQRFHAIVSGGVLHHLPDPEGGFRALSAVLAPGGAMRVMVYNNLQRLAVAVARAQVQDLVSDGVTDDALRAVRKRLMDRAADQPVIASVISSRDFYTLPGAHDLLLHRHEEGFDVARIERALAGAGLELLRFWFRNPVLEARYRAAFPGDPQQRDSRSWARFVREEPGTYDQHHNFWCYKPRG